MATSFPAFGDAYGSKINNVLGAGGTNVDDPKIATYRQAHLDVTGKVADYWASANTYAALQILEQAIVGAGTVDRAIVTQYIKDNSEKDPMVNPPAEANPYLKPAKTGGASLTRLGCARARSMRLAACHVVHSSQRH